jgi:hydroxymethylpyrimidine pyrophosphatase-like HAD family hydrolase/hypoxanthine phosphoribosyltransferase
LLVEDLRLSLADLGSLLQRTLGDGDPVDTFLLATGAAQILRDYLEDDPADLLRTANFVAKTQPERIGKSVRAGATIASRLLSAARNTTRGRHRWASVVARLDVLSEDLAMAVLTGDPLAKVDRAVLDDLAVRAPWPAHLESSSVRLPSCFRSFDQHPRDVRALARRVLERWPSSDPQFMVLGVRTTGAYLAPMLAAALRLEGCGQVPWVTLRPGHPPSSHSRAALTEWARSGARLLVIDDPPGTGSTLARVAKEVQALGFQPEQTCLTLALFDQQCLPSQLRHLPAVILEWRDWDIHRRLGSEAVLSMLEQSLGYQSTITALRPLEIPRRSSVRAHARVGYSASLTTTPGGDPAMISLVAEGTGLGYLGRHAIVVSRALPELVPEVVGFHDGVTLRRWLPETARVTLDSAERVSQAVNYVTRRRTALPARRDAAAVMDGQRPVWEVASHLLTDPYARLGIALREAGLDAAVRAILAPSTSSVIDGRMSAGSWFEDHGSLLKVDFSASAFTNFDLACYDAAYDLAGITLGITNRELAAAARAQFESVTGEPVDPERWLLYQWVQLWDRRRRGKLAPAEAESAVARAWQGWARDRLLGGALDDVSGPLCALDIDGVLESSRLGAPVLTPSAAAGLRALHAHGYRPLLATGRSLGELQDRCINYGLLGGVAEYGGVAYVRATSVVRELVDDDARAAVGAAHAFLADLDGVFLAENFRTMIRAYRLSASGARVHLDPETIRAALAVARGALRAEAGVAQTDFLPIGSDKALGLKTLMELLDASGDVAAFAVGDSACDLAMLRSADQGFLPSHARRFADGTVQVTEQPYQRGFAEAVDRFLGHSSEGCPRCREPLRRSSGSELLATLLTGFEGGRARALAEVPQMFARAWSESHRGHVSASR